MRISETLFQELDGEIFKKNNDEFTIMPKRRNIVKHIYIYMHLCMLCNSNIISTNMNSSVEVRKSQYTFFITIWSVCHLSYRIRKNDACSKINYIERCTEMHTHTLLH